MKVIDSACDWVRPIYLAESEIVLIETETITRATAAQILAHNETVEKLCPVASP